MIWHDYILEKWVQDLVETKANFVLQCVMLTTLLDFTCVGRMILRVTGGGYIWQGISWV
jgi:hypothetical protein